MLRRIERLGWLVLGGSTLAAALFSASLALGLGLGGLLALGNFRCMDLYFARVFHRGASARVRWWHHALYAARFLGLMAAVTGAIVWLKASAVGVAAGLSVPLLAISLYGAAAALRGKPASAGI